MTIQEHRDVELGAGGPSWRLWHHWGSLLSLAPVTRGLSPGLSFPTSKLESYKSICPRG